jgi:ketosteroid isomerase-like protein
MSQENVEVVRAAMTAFRDGRPWSGFVTPDFTWDLSTAPGLWPEAQRYRRIEAVQGFLTEWTQAFDEWAYAIDEAIDCGEQVVLVVHERGRIKGTATEVGGTWAYLSTLTTRGCQRPRFS